MLEWIQRLVGPAAALAAFIVPASSASALEAAPLQPDAPGGFTLAAGGDLLGPYHAFAAGDDEGLKAVSSLFTAADVGFANQEGSIFDLASFPGYPAAENGGGYPVQPPELASDFRAFGLDLVSKANNHATDWGSAGLAATLRSLAAARIVAAGAGLDDAEARAPAYLQTRKGVVALVDCASTFPPMAVAGPAVLRLGRQSQPRPGLSPLHVRELRLIAPADLQALVRIAGPSALPTTSGDVRIGDQVFRASSRHGTAWEVEPADEAAVLQAVRDARHKARLVLFSIHAHETGGDEDTAPADYQPLVLHRADEAPSPDDPRPAAFEPALFHAAIDAGADAVIRTGPHVVGGVEIYKGRPIFYSLGSLFFSFNGRRTYTSPAGQQSSFPDAWFESVVPVTTYRGVALAEIRLHPVVIESSRSPTDGYPRPAPPALARKILERVAALSLPYGVRVEIEGEVGVIRPETGTPAPR